MTCCWCESLGFTGHLTYLNSAASCAAPQHKGERRGWLDFLGLHMLSVVTLWWSFWLTRDGRRCAHVVVASSAGFHCFAELCILLRHFLGLHLPCHLSWECDDSGKSQPFWYLDIASSYSLKMLSVFFPWMRLRTRELFRLLRAWGISISDQLF